MISKRPGAFLEAVINRSIKHWSRHKKALFSKLDPCVIVKNKRNGFVQGVLQKSFCDYYGLYRGYYFEFEAKQTEQNFFLKSNLKKHQWERIKNVNLFGGHAFLIIYFVKTNEYFFVSENLWLKWLITIKTQRIPLTEFQEKAIMIKITSEKYLKLLPLLNTLLQNT